MYEQICGQITTYFKRKAVPKNRLTIQYIPEPSIQKINCSYEAFEMFRNAWDDRLINIQEQVYVIYMNRSNRVISVECVHTGGVCETLIDVKLIFSMALACLATGIVIAHNHPSGELNPSPIDVEMTQDIEKVCGYHNIKLFDHLIISDNNYFSLKDSGFID